MGKQDTASLLDSITLVDVMGDKPMDDDFSQSGLSVPATEPTEKPDNTKPDDDLQKDKNKNEDKKPLADAEGDDPGASGKPKETEGPSQKGDKNKGQDNKDNTDPEPDPDKKPSDEPAPQVIDLVKERLGYEVEGDFSNDVDGLVELAKKAVPKAAEEMVSQMLDEFPEAKDLIDHLAKGYSVDTWRQAVQNQDILSMEIKEDDLDLQAEMAKTQLLDAGYPEDSIDDMVADLKEKGKLYSFAKNALGKRQEALKETLERTKAAEALSKKEQEAKIKKDWDNIRGIIDKGNLDAVVIPQAKQGAFWDYLTVPIKDSDGTMRTKSQIKLASLSMEQKLLLEYLAFTDFKVLPGTRSTGQSLQALADANKGREPRLQGGSKGDSRKGSPDDFATLDGVDKGFFFK